MFPKTSKVIKIVSCSFFIALLFIVSLNYSYTPVQDKVSLFLIFHRKNQKRVIY